MKSALRFISTLLICYVAYDIYQSPMSASPSPFWEFSEGSVIDSKLATFFILFGLIAFLIGGGVIYGVCKFIHGFIQQTIESFVPAQLKVIAPLVALCCLLYPINSYKSEVKQLSVSTALQVDLVLNVSDKFDVKVKQKEKQIDA